MKTCYNNPKLSSLEKTADDFFTENLMLRRELAKTKDVNGALWSFVVFFAFGVFAYLLMVSI